MSEKWNKYWNALTKQQQGMHGLALANEVIAQLEAWVQTLEYERGILYQRVLKHAEWNHEQRPLNDDAELIDAILGADD